MSAGLEKKLRFSSLNRKSLEAFHNIFYRLRDHEMAELIQVNFRF